MPPRAYTRVAVAQLDCLPAVAFPDRAPFEDPLFDLARPDSLLPQGTPPPELDSLFRALRERIARSHFHQLLLKVQAILSACQQWGVRILVFPEYSLPWQVLEDVARSSGDLVVVAGTHMVTRPARRSGLYERLGVTKPDLGEAVCPVLHRGRLLGLQPKLSPAKLEQGVLKPGQKWAPIPLPATARGLPHGDPRRAAALRGQEAPRPPRTEAGCERGRRPGPGRGHPRGDLSLAGPLHLLR